MIRTMMTMFALGTLTITSASAMAATKVQARAHHQSMKTPVVAAAEGSAPTATDEAKPADAKAAKDTTAKAHKGHKAKASAKAKDAAGGETAGTPAPEAPQK
ncbi:MAG TPA: hypothetical protein VIU64_14170 [Polyangia bacterium]